MVFTSAKYRPIFLTSNSFAQNVLIVLIANLFLAVISQVAIPWQPVPLTFQSAAVILLGLTLGSKRAFAAVALYLLEGACGLPVFAEASAGFPVFLAATGGYLLGFLPAAFLAGFLVENGMAKNPLLIFASAILSATILFLCGVLHLQALVGWKSAYLLGVKPFMITEPLKLIVASSIAAFTWKKI